jgi:hypothetical protein
VPVRNAPDDLGGVRETTAIVAVVAGATQPPPMNNRFFVCVMKPAWTARLRGDLSQAAHRLQRGAQHPSRPAVGQ